VDNNTIVDAALNPLNGTSTGTTFTTGEAYEILGPIGVEKYDDADLAGSWRYTGTWFTYSGSGPYSNTMHYTYGAGNSAEIAMTGRAFKLTYTASANYGILDVYVDNVKVASLNQNSSPSGYQKTWSSGLLSAGTHNLRFVKSGSALQVNIDAIEVIPVSFAGLYDDVNTAITYGGTWFTMSGASGPSAGTLHYTYGLGNSAQMVFAGQQFKLTYTASPNYGVMDIYVDGVLVKSLNQNSSPSGYKKTWTSNPLSAGLHTVRFVKAGSTLQMNIDALEIIDVAPAVLSAGKYDNVNAGLVYSGSWFTLTGATGPYLGTLHYTFGLGNSVQTYINGTQLALTYTASINYGVLDIYIDDVLVTSLNQNSLPSGYQKTWTSSVLTAGVHSVRMVKAGSTLQTNIDAITVSP
jgi:hypothetical protein